MSNESIGLERFRAGLVSAGRRVGAAQDELCQLDALAGDGDLGVTLAVGFDYAEQALDADSPGDLGALLQTIGLQLTRNAASTIGALLGGSFLQMGRELSGCSELGSEEIAALLESAAVSVAKRGGAVPGQRTVLDAMDGAATAARSAVAHGLGALDVLRLAAAGASQAAAATATMEPMHGRAGWVAERARGREDAGALAWALYLEGLSDALSASDGPWHDE